MFLKSISIEIVSSNIRALSSMGTRSREAANKSLSKNFNTRITTVNNASDLEQLIKRKPDLVFLGMKFLPVSNKNNVLDADKMWMSEVLDSYDIAHTGSSWFAHHLELNKPLAKKHIMRAGFSTAPFYVHERGSATYPEIDSNMFPVFVKPTNLGGGAGIDSQSVAYSSHEMRTKIKSLSDNFEADSLVESYLPGREFSVAVLRKECSADYSVMPIELIAPKDNAGIRMLSSRVKSGDQETVSIVNDGVLRDKINKLAMGSFIALGARDYGRIDIRLDEKGEPQFLEANLIPSIIEDYGSFPKSCLLNKGISYSSMLNSVVNLALHRKKQSKNGYESLTLSPLPANV